MANQSGYTGAQIMAMQKDAMRRVNEMQRISREKLRQTQGIMQEAPRDVNPPANPEETEIEEESNEEMKQMESEECSQETGDELSMSENRASGLQGILQRMNLDSETIMILLLVLALVNEGADNMLILALVYILL